MSGSSSKNSKKRGGSTNTSRGVSDILQATEPTPSLPPQTSSGLAKVLPTIDADSTPKLRPVGSTIVGGSDTSTTLNDITAFPSASTSTDATTTTTTVIPSHDGGVAQVLSISSSVPTPQGIELQTVTVDPTGTKTVALTTVSPADFHADLGCMHHKSTLTECGHEECLSPEELKALGARRTLIWASAFCFFFMCCEIVGGYLSNSLAIITDAAHLLSDLASFLISIMSLIIARQTPTTMLSFGFHRAEILGAILSVLIIWLMTGGLLYEAYQRLVDPQPINGKLMFIVASLGLVVNLGMGFILMQSGHGHSHGGLSSAHGHSHGDEEDDHDEHDHGHSHGTKGEAHGHSHAGSHSDDEESSHEATAKTALLSSHGHSHGASYGSHGSSAESHAHSHGGHDHDDHGHSHGSRRNSHGHAHSDHGSDHSHAHGRNRQDNELSLWDKIFHNPKHNINIRAALVHALGDALQSMGVMVAAGLIWWNPKYAIADPICTVFFSIIVLFTTIRIMKEAVLILMEATPDAIDAPTVASQLLMLPGVIRIHDLHIWSLSVGLPALSVHVTIDPTRVDNADALQAAQELLRRKYRISHTTIQIETLTDDIACNNSNKVRQCVKV